MTLVVSLLVLAAVAAGVFWLYRGGARNAGDAPQPVGAPLRDVRVAAPPQPKAEDPAAGLTIYKDNGAQPAAPTFAPAPEEPSPRPGAVSANPAAPAAAPNAGAAGDQIGALLEKSAAPAAAKPQRVAQNDAKAATKSAAKISATETAEAATPAKPAKAAKVPATTAVATTTARAGAPEVQIGAFTTKAQAQAAWTAAAAAAPRTMAGKGRRLTEVERDGKTLYRVTITGAATPEAAGALCRQLKASGHACIVR